MKRVISLIVLFFVSLPISAYELVVVQGVSEQKQTFVTRNTEVGNKDIFEGKKVTFTSDNVSIIAKAITVTNEFIQWEIMNDYTDVPFTQGEIITLHDAKEYLWALTPSLAKKKYFRSITYAPRRSFEAQMFFTKGLSESVSNTTPQNVDRGGYQFEFSFHHEISMNLSLAYGIRYARDNVNLPDITIINTQFLATIEGRYYFPPMLEFYNARIGLGLGFGYGATRTQIDSYVVSGNAALVPSTKISLLFPYDDESDIEFAAGFESLRLDESDAAEQDVTTNITQSKMGVIYRKHI